MRNRNKRRTKQKTDLCNPEDSPYNGTAPRSVVFAGLIMTMMEDLNWAGFYLVRGGELVVGPFQGKPACIHIPVGKGVCGTAILQDRMQVVPDVHEFPGHIACDSASASEIVIPIHAGNRIAAVLDIDSPVKDRFSAEDAAGLAELVRLIEKKISWE